MIFRDRHEAGRMLAAQLSEYAHNPSVMVLALPRGGVPVGYEVAKALAAPLDVIVVRKLGYPGQPELAMGAMASCGVVALNEEAIEALEIPEETLRHVAARESRELRRQEAAFRQGREPPEVAARTVILVDDGLATGSTMRAAVKALKLQHPVRLVVAVPVGAAATCAEFAREVDEVVCCNRPADFRAVGLWYDDFSPTSDDDVRRLLADAASREPINSAPYSE